MIAEFKYIQSTWGIAITITIIERAAKDFDNNTLVLLSDKIAISFKASNITSSGKEYLCKAITDNIYILKRIIEPSILDIVNVEYTLSDYQEEGMYCVMISWLNKKYNLSLKTPEISFNKQTNKYEFSFE